MAEFDRYLEGKHAIVTGGGRGIGAAIAAGLVRHGADVTIMGRSAEWLAASLSALADFRDLHPGDVHRGQQLRRNSVMSQT